MAACLRLQPLQVSIPFDLGSLELGAPMFLSDVTCFGVVTFLSIFPPYCPRPPCRKEVAGPGVAVVGFPPSAHSSIVGKVTVRRRFPDCGATILTKPAKVKLRFSTLPCLHCPGPLRPALMTWNWCLNKPKNDRKPPNRDMYPRPKVPTRPARMAARSKPRNRGKMVQKKRTPK